MEDDSLNHKTGAGAVSLAKSEPLTIGPSDHFDSVAQKRLPLGAELQLALNLIPAHTWYAAPSGTLTFLNERGSDYLGLPKDHPHSARDRHRRGVGFSYPFSASG